jgi:glycosyltransferase involved in cell wall biosynthesis
MSGRFAQPVIRFLHVANQTPVKGQEMMLKVFSAVSGSFTSRLVIVGADYYNGKLKEWCADLGIEDKVSFLGPQPHERMPEIYQNADILLHTPEYEGQGMVFAEAAACGTLIAGTNVGMLSDMGDECALIVNSGQHQMLAEKIAAVISSRTDYRQMQRNALKWIQEKDVNYTEAALTRVLNELNHYADTKRSKESSHQVKR